MRAAKVGHCAFASSTLAALALSVITQTADAALMRYSRSAAESCTVAGEITAPMRNAAVKTSHQGMTRGNITMIASPRFTPADAKTLHNFFEAWLSSAKVLEASFPASSTHNRACLAGSCSAH